MRPIKHVYVIPRWGGDSSSDWYPWLKQQLEATGPEDGFNYQVELMDMPAWDVPTIQQADAHLSRVLPPDQLNEDVILVGHSVGCLAILHHLAKVAEHQPNVRVGGVLCVAGWFSIVDPWQDILYWMEAPIDYPQARQLIPQDKLLVLLSDNDVYTPGYQENETLWLTRLQARVSILSGREHFKSSLDPDVRDSIRDLAGGLPDPTWPATFRQTRAA
jgi:predicted alpha/beta hydrolase family esterase